MRCRPAIVEVGSLSYVYTYSHFSADFSDVLPHFPADFFCKVTHFPHIDQYFLRGFCVLCELSIVAHASLRAIFHVALGGSVPNLEDSPATLLRVTTPSKILPMCHEYYPAIADTPTTPLISRFRLWLIFNVIRIVGCLW